MYQPYPASTRMPELGKPPAPPQVTNAIRAMYAGAAATIVGVVIEILTVSGTRTAIEKSLAAAVSPVAVAVRAWWPVIWLAGLTAVIFLWQRASTGFFKGYNQ